MPAVHSGSDQRPFAEINVTPFVDVVLVLLIIFMVTAPMMQQGIDVDLPDTTTQNLRVRNEPLIITVKKDGSYFLANTKVTEKELGAKLHGDPLGSRRQGGVPARGQGRGLRSVVKALAAARLAGATKLGMVTEPES